MADLELIRLAEIHDERDDRLEALEGVVRNLQIWRTETDGYIDDIHYDLRRHLPRSPTTQLQHPSLTARRESAAAVLHPGGPTVDWPSGHRDASTTQAPAYGSVTTIALTPANGMPNHPVSDFVLPRYNPYPPSPASTSTTATSQSPTPPSTSQPRPSSQNALPKVRR